MKDKWVVDVWNEACMRKGASPNLLPQDEEFTCSSMRFFADMKMNIKHAVEFSYEFDTSQAPNSINHNESHAQALLTGTTFVYQESNFRGRPRYPYRHPIIQKVINVTWFNNRDDVGIVFHEYFTPIPFEVIALVLTVIECCIDEWSTGTRKESMWKEEDYKTKYLSHLDLLRDITSRGPDQKGKNLLAWIQHDLLKNARIHSGAPPDFKTGAGLITLRNTAQDDPPDYDLEL
jgi:hypothetical protein